MILVIDDDDAILDVTRIILEDEGYLVKTSSMVKHCLCYMKRRLI